MRYGTWVAALVAVWLCGCDTASGGGAAVAEDTTTDSQIGDATGADAAQDAAQDGVQDAVADVAADVAADAGTDATVVGWTIFTISQGGFCAPTSNCTSKWNLSPDGTFTADKGGKASSGKLSTADFAAVQASLGTLAFLDKMKSGFTCGQPPTDIGVSFTYALFGVSYTQDVTGCALTGGADATLVQGLTKTIMAY